ncbi:DUF433 domain-containing protein [Spirosoma areae]
MLPDVILINPKVMGGTPVFKGTRVPIQHLLDHLENNATIDEFISGFPSVSKEQAIALIQLISRSILSDKMLEVA